MFWWMLAFEGGLAVVGALAALLTGVPLPSPLPRSLTGALAASFPLCVLYLVFERVPGAAFQRIRDFLEEVVRPLFSGLPPWRVWAVALAAGIGEEIAFRGFLQMWLERQGLPPFGFIGITAVVFGALHWITPLYAVLATAIGAYLGWVFWKTQDLGIAILAHGIYDGFALTRFLQGKSRKT